MRDQTFMALMRLLPRSALSSAVGVATRLPAPAKIHQLAIRTFARRYGVAVREAELELSAYPTFGEFFARRLKPGLRVVDPTPGAVVSPVDGAVSQVGYSENGECLQAKGVCYPVASLLADAQMAHHFVGGAYATLYLSPRDYHRIHAPLDAEIEGYSYIPGEFWPVNPASVRLKDRLFCINERLTTYLRTDLGRLAVVMVGATCVSRIRAAYDDVVTHTGGQAKVHRYERPLSVKKGQELGVFEMGSTVILLFEKGRVKWGEGLVEGTRVRMGQRIGAAA